MIAVQEVCNYGDLCRPELLEALMWSALFVFTTALTAGMVAGLVGDYTLELKGLRLVAFVAACVVVAGLVAMALSAVFYDAAWTDYRRSR